MYLNYFSQSGYPYTDNLLKEIDLSAAQDFTTITTDETDSVQAGEFIIQLEKANSNLQ